MSQFVEVNGHRIEFPDGMPPEQMEAVLKQNAASFKPKEDGFMQWVMDDLRAAPGKVANLAAGAVRGAGSIGATIAAPYDMARDALDGKGLSLESNRSRRSDMDAALATLGADPNSLQFKAGKLGGEIAGTAGVGGVLANGMRALPFAGRGADALAMALESGGFRTALPGAQALPVAQNIATRAGAGAATGGASAAAVNPSDAPAGAAIGAVLPGAVQVAGNAAVKVYNAFKAATTPQLVKQAQQLAQALGVTADDLKALQTGPQMIKDYQPTVPQLLQDPVASQLQRTVQTAGVQSVADAGRAQQGQFRDAFNRIAPAGGTEFDAANRAGTAIQNYAIPAERAAKGQVTNLFNSIPRNEAKVQLPMQQMQDAQTKYLGAGSFGPGRAPVEDAMSTATNIGMDAATMTPKVVPFDQIQSLRSSIGEAASQARTAGNVKAAAALEQMRNEIDNKVADVAAGNALPGEIFTPQAVDAWGQALKAHAAKKQQFNTGPQVGMFRNGADGQPVIQGAEIPGKFYNATRSQADDIAAFHRLIGDQQSLAQEMKSYALTQANQTATQNGNLAQGFIDWAKSRSGANAALFSKQEMATINEVGKAVQRQINAENLGRVSGPDTAQKLTSLMNNGMLDNRVVDVLANRIPIVGSFTGPMLAGLRNTAAQTRNGLLGQLLADPAAFESALRRGPGLLNFEPEALGLLNQAASRSFPLLPSQ